MPLPLVIVLTATLAVQDVVAVRTADGPPPPLAERVPRLFFDHRKPHRQVYQEIIAQHDLTMGPRADYYSKTQAVPLVPAPSRR
jgi:hypothetical protein